MLLHILSTTTEKNFGLSPSFSPSATIISSFLQQPNQTQYFYLSSHKTEFRTSFRWLYNFQQSNKHKMCSCMYILYTQKSSHSIQFPIGYIISSCPYFSFQHLLYIFTLLLIAQRKKIKHKKKKLFLVYVYINSQFHSLFFKKFDIIFYLKN